MGLAHTLPPDPSKPRGRGCAKFSPLNCQNDSSGGGKSPPPRPNETVGHLWNGDPLLVGQKCPGLSIPSVAFHDGSRKNLWFSPLLGKSVKIVTKYCYRWERWLSDKNGRKSFTESGRSERPLFNSVPFWDSVTFRYWVVVSQRMGPAHT